MMSLTIAATVALGMITEQRKLMFRILWEIYMRALIAFLMCLLGATSSSASIIYDIDVFGNSLPSGITTLGSLHSTSENPEGGFAGLLEIDTATYVFGNSGIADFGTLILEPYFTPCRSVSGGCNIPDEFGHITLGAYYLGQWGSTKDPNAWQASFFGGGAFSYWQACLSSQPCNPPPSETINLIFNVTAGESLTLWWGGDADFAYQYVAPPVPEPSTWAMLLIGFAAIGLWSYVPKFGARARHQYTQR